jgi:hypothetical protein
MLGIATAEAPTGTAARTVSVEGVATVAIGQKDSAAAATAAYRQGMAGAVADGQSKAEFLASKVGATLGSVQSVIEGGGYIECTGQVQSGEVLETGSVAYEGEQPDFGTAARTQPPYAAAVAPVKAAPVQRKATPKHKKRKHPVAKKAATATAATATCKLSAQVSLSYAIN